MIRRILVATLTLIAWSVQFADAATDYSDVPASFVASVAAGSVAAQDVPASDLKSGCPVDCICHVFHHANLPTAFARPFHQFEREAFEISSGVLQTCESSAPPFRPPLS